MDAGKEALSFVIFDRAAFVIAALRGRLTRENLAAFTRFQDDLERRQGHYFLLSLLDVTEIDHKLVPPLVRLQKRIRDAEGYLQVCVADPRIMRFLMTAGALHTEEISPTVTEGLVTLQSIARVNTPAEDLSNVPDRIRARVAAHARKIRTPPPELSLSEVAHLHAEADPEPDSDDEDK